MVLREFNNTMIDKEVVAAGKTFTNWLFYNCTFRSVAGLSLTNCVLDRSRFLVDRISDALGFTLTLNCFSFSDVEYSELLFDLLLYLLTTTKGNDEKREKITQILGVDKMQKFERVLKRD